MIAKEIGNGRLGDVNIEITADGEELSSVAFPDNASGENGDEASPRIDEERNFKRVLEALLFVSHDPITLDRLTGILEGPPKGVVQEAIRALQMEYEREERGLCIKEVAGGFVMVTSLDCAPYIRRLTKAKAQSKLSRSALETLAIVSYKQPITRADVERIRGVETSGVLRTLLDQKLVRIVGRQDVPGRPLLYGTTKQFLQRFGLRDLRDLPPLAELPTLEDISSSLEDRPDKGNANGSIAELPV